MSNNSIGTSIHHGGLGTDQREWDLHYQNLNAAIHEHNNLVLIPGKINKLKVLDNEIKNLKSQLNTNTNAEIQEKLKINIDNLETKAKPLRPIKVIQLNFPAAGSVPGLLHKEKVQTVSEGKLRTQDSVKNRKEMNDFSHVLLQNFDNLKDKFSSPSNLIEFNDAFDNQIVVNLNKIKSIVPQNNFEMMLKMFLLNKDDSDYYGGDKGYQMGFVVAYLSNSMELAAGMGCKSAKDRMSTFLMSCDVYFQKLNLEHDFSLSMEDFFKLNAQDLSRSQEVLLNSNGHSVHITAANTTYAGNKNGLAIWSLLKQTGLDTLNKAEKIFSGMSKNAKS